MRKFFRITRGLRWQTLAVTAIVPILSAILMLLTLNVVSDTSVFAESVIGDLELAKSMQMVGDREIFNVDAVARFLNNRRDKQIETATTGTKNNVATITTKPTTQSRVDRLIIPKIGLNAQLMTVGVTANYAVDVHPTLPAWFNQSSRAGRNDGYYKATFIDGHRGGIFNALGRLAVGDTVTVDFANGEKYTYTVVKIEIRSIDDPKLMDDALSIYGGASYGLNIMTCDGKYLPDRGTQESRLVIYTTR